MDIGIYNKQSLRVTHGGVVPADTIQLSWGTESGNLPNTTTQPFTEPMWQVRLDQLLPGPGTYYAKAVISNKIGSLESAEYPFECGVAPDGTLTFSIG